jgi:hypothetical protein
MGTDRSTPFCVDRLRHSPIADREIDSAGAILCLLKFNWNLSRNGSRIFLMDNLSCTFDRPLQTYKERTITVAILTPHADDKLPATGGRRQAE